jgi:predicted helicase
MSIHSVKQYQAEVEKIIHFGGTKKETAIRNAFYNLLNEYAKQRGLMLVAEISIKGSLGKTVIPDGTLKDSLRQDWGYWESKDEADDIDEEIEKKFAKGYPKGNILFEDSNTAVLIQDGNECMRVSISDTDALDRLITQFASYRPPHIDNFHKAIELFKQDIPKVTETLRGIIVAEGHTNVAFREAEATFLSLCKESINPEISRDDVREMMIQHILTEDIFNSIFGETQFHRENNVARELEQVIQTFFKGNIKRLALGAIEHYYLTINAAAAQIADHHEKQKFLKVVYEIFYKGYNPKAADRLGVVYTPNEVVKFMIESTDYLLHLHFGKGLDDRGVEILDPATGTGTFVCDIIDYLPKACLPYKYQHEIHANEIAILPYYIANLNIEYTYKQKMGEYKEFESLCFADTLDNTKAFNHSLSAGNVAKYSRSRDLFALSTENASRIQRQNEKKISVVIGNPPYNANQMNENENNKNREYVYIDKRIKDTFIKESTAQKTKVYDMYARFYRWAMDRLDTSGIVSFITNRSFIESRTFDGFRKVLASEFSHIYIVDLGGDVRSNPKLSGTKHNVFGIQTGVAIAYLIRKNNTIHAESESHLSELKKELSLADEPTVVYEDKTFLSPHGCRIKYCRRPEFETAEQKLQFLGQMKFENVQFENIHPDANNNWINLSEVNDWADMTSVCSKDVKAGKGSDAIFDVFSLGIATNRDSWAYDLSQKKLAEKMKYFCDKYNSELKRWNTSDKIEATNNFVERSIKWTEELESYLKKGKKLVYNKKSIRVGMYRPFVKNYVYYDKVIIHRFYQQHKMHPIETAGENKTIAFRCISADTQLTCLSTDFVSDLAYLKMGNGGTFSLPLYQYDKEGNRHDNLTDWGLQQFQNHYSDQAITKENIFHYVYAVLHYPAYRTKYELNLKRDFPRIPFYKDFGKWTDWGKALMELHICYETVAAFNLKETTDSSVSQPKAKLKADKEKGIIMLDDATSLSGIPAEAWQYKLGNRSALEWILDQYKEKKPTDPTIAEQFNTYRFVDYKPQVIDLLKRVCTVSVETMKIIDAMQNQ